MKYHQKTHCYYPNCNLRCRSISVHKAKYAKISKLSTVPPKDKYTKTISPKINYEALKNLNNKK